MTAYIKEWSVGTKVLGIEDHEDGKPATEHFFHRDYKVGNRKRFSVWIGGCGCGQADTLEEALAIAARRAAGEAKSLRQLAADLLKDAGEWRKIACDLILEELE